MITLRHEVVAGTVSVLPVEIVPGRCLAIEIEYENGDKFDIVNFHNFLAEGQKALVVKYLDSRLDEAMGRDNHIVWLAADLNFNAPEEFPLRLQAGVLAKAKSPWAGIVAT